MAEAYLNYTTTMDNEGDESSQKYISFLENDECRIFSDFDMNSVVKELEVDGPVDPAELSWKESITTILSNFSSLEVNAGFDMTSLTQHTSPQKPKSCILSFEDSTSVPIDANKTCHEHAKQTQEKKPHNRKPLKRKRTPSKTYDHIMAERKRERI
ncbi:unnamed protein product [Sphenostylis stenocarpa]|uniref:Uncharacterized protein n=1 Tax=Sphenostylis stenocarpa TaxID=92480 RepID=A0AA86S9T8_9FABA|nr:unnamed protein product [Sphenostylis stenocarpa]